MDNQKMIWVVEYDDFDEGWHPWGTFSTKEKAEAYVKAALADEDFKRHESSFRIEWEYMDPEYV